MSEKQTKVDEFYCPYCTSWLVDGGTGHDPNHHNDSDKLDNVPVKKWRETESPGGNRPKEKS